MKQNQQHGRDQMGTAYRWMSSALDGIKVAWLVYESAGERCGASLAVLRDIRRGDDARMNIRCGDDAKPTAAEPTARTPATETTPGNPPQSTSYL
jgi:hypothetical protein